MDDVDEITELPEPEREWLARVTDPDLMPRGNHAALLVPATSPAELEAQVQQLRVFTAVAPSTAFRRILFMWLRVYALEHKASGKQSRVNVRVPIPLPLVGLLLPWRMSKKQALALLNMMYDSTNGAALAERALASHMPFEIVHVEESNPKTGAWEYVVVGLE
jgi:hypothetical protein